MKIRRQPLTDKRLEKVGTSFRQMYVLTRLLELEYLHYMDSDFKCGITHQKIKRIKEDINFVMKRHLHAVDSPSDEVILDPIHDLNEVIKVLINLEPHKIGEFAKGLKQLNHD